MTSNDTEDGRRHGTGELVVFWGWAGVIAAGLAVMITIPLIGR